MGLKLAKRFALSLGIIAGILCVSVPWASADETWIMTNSACNIYYADSGELGGGSDILAAFATCQGPSWTADAPSLGTVYTDSTGDTPWYTNSDDSGGYNGLLGCSDNGTGGSRYAYGGPDTPIDFPASDPSDGISYLYCAAVENYPFDYNSLTDTAYATVPITGEATGEALINSMSAVSYGSLDSWPSAPTVSGEGGTTTTTTTGGTTTTTTGGTTTTTVCTSDCDSSTGSTSGAGCSWYDPVCWVEAGLTYLFEPGTAYTDSLDAATSNGWATTWANNFSDASSTLSTTWSDLLSSPGYSCADYGNPVAEMVDGHLESFGEYAPGTDADWFPGAQAICGFENTSLTALDTNESGSEIMTWLKGGITVIIASICIYGFVRLITTTLSSGH